MPADRDAAHDGTADCLRGRLCRERLDLGSKSERLAVLLVVDDGDRVVLRRAGANPFRDPELEALEGQVLIVEGERRSSYFLVRRYTVCGDDPPSSG